MIRDSVGRAASMAQLIAAALLALVGVRFAAHGVVFAVRERAPSLEPSARPAPAPEPKLSAAPSASAAPLGSEKLGATLRVAIVVNSKAPRAEVRIDGVSVGNTPYVGEVTCRAGEKVQISVNPGRNHEGTCAPGTLRIDPDR